MPLPWNPTHVRKMADKTAQDVAKRLGRRSIATPMSGGGFVKGDVKNSTLLIEIKETDRDSVSINRKSISIKKDWWEKIKAEAFAANREPVLVIRDGKEWLTITAGRPGDA